MKVLMTLVKVNIEEVLKSNNRDYNPAEWDKIVRRYESYDFTEFYERTDSMAYGRVSYYAVYMIDGIRRMKKMEYSSSLTSGLVVAYCLHDGKLSKVTADGYGYPDTPEALAAIREDCLRSTRLIFTKDI